MGENKNARGSASQFYVAGELCRRDLVAVVTMGNTPNTDILCSNTEGTKFVHIQVKTFVPNNNTVTVGKKAEKDYGDNFIWVLAGIPKANTDSDFVYYIIPSPVLAKNIAEQHKKWLSDTGKNGLIRKDSDVRTVTLPPKTNYVGWSIKEYENRWDIIEDLLK
jgi:hypothetical protein